MSDKTNGATKVGELSGGWLLMTKVVLTANGILVPLVVAWATWVTSSIFTLNAWKSIGPRFTQSDGMALKSVTKDEMRVELMGIVNGLRSEITDLRRDVLRAQSNPTQPPK